jgi:hypothetical protein
MPKSALALAYVAALYSWTALGAQAGSRPPSAGAVEPPPAYSVSFERGRQIQGINSSAVVALPFQCTADGTIFVRFVSGAPAGITPTPLQTSTLVSISPSGLPHSFLLGQVPDLHILSEVDHYAYDSGVIFLIRGTANSTGHDSNRDTPAERAATRHTYIISFDRDGRYQRTTEVDDRLRIQRLAVFASGIFLVFGYDPKGHAPELTLLKEDGTYLRSLDVPTGAMPNLAIGTEGAKQGVLVAVEFVRLGSSVMVLQTQGDFPILEVSQGGTVRAVPNKLPSGIRIDDLVPSDGNVFALVKADRNSRHDSMYEIRPQDGTVQRIFTMDDERDAAAVACVHDGKFLSLDYADGKVTPLVGTAEPSR